MSVEPFYVEVLLNPHCNCGAAKIVIRDGPPEQCHSIRITVEQAQRFHTALGEAITEASRVEKSK